MLCFNCKKDMVYRAAGVSKTKLDDQGNPKAYKAFWACPICRKTMPYREGEKVVSSDSFSPTPKETGNEILVELLTELLERVKGIEIAVGNNMVNIGK